MGKTYERITDELKAFMEAQRMFFVATAPLAAEGHVNLSPKGLTGLKVTGPKTVVYLDLTGSGAETIAHLKENSRIVLMFCAFEGPPKIARIHGRGEVIEPAHPDFEKLSALFPSFTGTRSFIRVGAERVSDSCGFGVPLYEYKGERAQLTEWADKRGAEGIAEYQRTRNERSIDGLPAVDWR